MALISINSYRITLKYGPSSVIKRRRLSTTASCSSPFRILFFGADSFSCTTLQALHEAREGLIEELVVVTPPDARTGRALKHIHIPPLRKLAESLHLPSIALPAELLTDWQPPPSFLRPSPSTLLITSSFGHLIPTSLLRNFEPLNALNVHPSLLPKFRGAAPIQWAIVHGDRETGVSVQELSRGRFDRGRLLAQEKVMIPENSDFEQLEPILAQKGADLLVRVLKNLKKVQANAQPQTGEASNAFKIDRECARILWSNKSASEILQRQRGIGHQFSLWCLVHGSNVEASPKIIQLRITDPQPTSASSTSSLEPGSATLDPRLKKLVVGSKDGLVFVDKVKSVGGKWIDGREWWNGVGRTHAVEIRSQKIMVLE